MKELNSAPEVHSSHSDDDSNNTEHQSSAVDTSGSKSLYVNEEDLIEQDYKCTITGHPVDMNSSRMLGGDIVTDQASSLLMACNWSKEDLFSAIKDIVKYNDLTNNISTPIKCRMNEKLVWKGIKLNTENIAKLSMSDRLEVTNDIHKFFLKYDFTKLSYGREIVDKDLAAIKSAVVDTEEVDGTTYITNSNITGSRAIRSFFPNMMQTRSGKKKSVYGCITDPADLYKICYNRMANYPFLNNKVTGEKEFEYFSITPAMIVQGAKSTGLAAHSSIFKPYVAKAIYERFVKDGDVVYDYSAGFGCRLLGMHATGIDAKYIAAEPNTDTHGRLRRLIKYLGANAEIVNKCSEDVVLDEKIDFAFSSPPYFDHELYCTEDTQCYNKFPEYDDWLEGYWRKTVQNIKSMANDGIVFGLNAGNLSNKKMAKVYKDMDKIVKEEGFELFESWNMKTARSHFSKSSSGKNQKLEPINFYKLK